MATKLKSITENPGWNKRQKKVFATLEEALPTVMSYASGDIPVLDNHSDAQIVDELGPVKALKKAVETAEKAHSDRLKVRMTGKKKLDGEDYYAEIRASERVAINQQAVKDFIEKCDRLEIDVMRLIDVVAKKELVVPNEVFLKVIEEEHLAAGAVEEEDVAEMTESNGKYFYGSTEVQALYIKEL